jgi:hypothetical protein
MELRQLLFQLLAVRRHCSQFHVTITPDLLRQ